MKNVYLFNPENDLALASGSIHYTAPKKPRKMATDLVRLPQWYAEKGNEAEFITAEQLGNCQYSAEDRLIPWGWNQSLLPKARKAGFTDRTLPGEEQIKLLRELSHRRTGVRLLEELTQSEPRLLCGKSTECYSLSEVEKFRIPNPHIILKAPWSCSGRGLLKITGNEIPLQSRQWIGHILSTQGSIIAEALQERVCDFALEFYVDKGKKITFKGYSLFETDTKGIYKRNILDTDEHIEQYLTRWIPASILYDVRCQLKTELESTLAITRYTGFLGIDMLVARFDSAPFYRLLPCVEINLRMNMGVLAHRLTQCLIEKGKRGIFCIDNFPTPELLFQDHEKNQKSFPLLTSDSLIRKGYYSLTPLTPSSLYRAAVWIDS